MTELWSSIYKKKATNEKDPNKKKFYEDHAKWHEKKENERIKKGEVSKTMEKRIRKSHRTHYASEEVTPNSQEPTIGEKKSMTESEAVARAGIQSINEAYRLGRIRTQAQKYGKEAAGYEKDLVGTREKIRRSSKSSTWKIGDKTYSRDEALKIIERERKKATSEKSRMKRTHITASEEIGKLKSNVLGLPSQLKSQKEFERHPGVTRTKEGYLVTTTKDMGAEKIAALVKAGMETDLKVGETTRFSITDKPKIDSGVAARYEAAPEYEKLGYRLHTLFSPKGFKYIGAPFFYLDPEDVVKEKLTELERRKAAPDWSESGYILESAISNPVVEVTTAALGGAVIGKVATTTIGGKILGSKIGQIGMGIAGVAALTPRAFDIKELAEKGEYAEAAGKTLVTGLDIGAFRAGYKATVAQHQKWTLEPEHAPKRFQDKIMGKYSQQQLENLQANIEYGGKYTYKPGEFSSLSKPSFIKGKGLGYKTKDYFGLLGKGKPEGAVLIRKSVPITRLEHLRSSGWKGLFKKPGIGYKPGEFSSLSKPNLIKGTHLGTKKVLNIGKFGHEFYGYKEVPRTRWDYIKSVAKKHVSGIGKKGASPVMVQQLDVRVQQLHSHYPGIRPYYPKRIAPLVYSFGSGDLSAIEVEELRRPRVTSISSRTRRSEPRPLDQIDIAEVVDVTPGPAPVPKEDSGVFIVIPEIPVEPEPAEPGEPDIVSPTSGGPYFSLIGTIRPKMKDRVVAITELAAETLGLERGKKKRIGAIVERAGTVKVQESLAEEAVIDSRQDFGQALGRFTKQLQRQKHLDFLKLQPQLKLRISEVPRFRFNPPDFEKVQPIPMGAGTFPFLPEKRKKRKTIPRKRKRKYSEKKHYVMEPGEFMNLKEMRRRIKNAW